MSDTKVKTYLQRIKSMDKLTTLQFKKNSNDLVVIRLTDCIIRIWHYFPKGGPVPASISSQPPTCKLIPGEIYIEIPISDDDLLMELAENLVKQGYKSTLD